MDPQVAVVLGGFGWVALLATLAEQGWGVPRPRPAFGHGVEVSLAGPGGTLVASLPASAANAGIALGSTVSGVAYTAAGPVAVVVTGLVIALGALALAMATRGLRPAEVAAPGPQLVVDARL